MSLPKYGGINMRIRRRLFAACILGAAFLSGGALACDAQDDDGADVAIVFSGGGALTSTQVGALKVIEELGVPIHCVVGTSQGALIAGLYASGKSVPEIVEIYRSPDWPSIMRGRISRRDKPYLQKEAEDTYFSGAIAAVDADGLQLPTGLRSMRGLKVFLRHAMAPLSVEEDFDALRVPFRPVAMDLSTADATAFASGDPVEAILASMSVPGVFSPREIDGRIYVDGGMAAQLPIGVAREMGADIIIALDTTVKPPELGEVPSVGGTTQQLIRHMVYQTYERGIAQMGEADILIRADLSDLSAASYHKMELGIERGVSAATAQRHQLLRARAAAAPPRDRAIDRPPVLVERLEVESDTALSDRVLINRLSLSQENLSQPETLDRKLKDLAAFGDFGEVDLGRRGDAPLLSAREHHLKGVTVQGGLRASTTFNGDSRYGLLSRFSYNMPGRRGAEASVSVEIGSDFGVTAEYYQPFGGRGRLFVVPAASYRQEELLFDFADFRIGEFVQKQASARMRVGREIGQWGVVALDGIVTSGKLDPLVTIAPEAIEAFSYDQGGLGTLVGIDTLDEGAWPLRGLQFTLSGNRVFDLSNADTTDRVNLFFVKPFRAGSYGAIVRAEAAAIYNEAEEPLEFLSLGGFRRLSGFSENSLPNNQYVLTNLELFRQISATDTIIGVPIYVGGVFEFAAVDFDIVAPDETGGIIGGSIYVGADTVVGPAYFGLGAATDSDLAVFLHLGRSF